MSALTPATPDLKGFTRRNLFRMRQFYETYRDAPILSTLLRELAWSAHLHILCRKSTKAHLEFWTRPYHNGCNNTRQGYARKRTLKLAGFSFLKGEK
jgi:hypothetical protein